MSARHSHAYCTDQKKDADTRESHSKHMQTAGCNRSTKQESEQARRENTADVAKGLELASGNPHLFGRRDSVERGLQAQVLQTIGHAKNHNDREQQHHRRV